jgi:cell division protein FtsQ
VLGYFVFALWYFPQQTKEVVCKSLEISIVDKENTLLISEKDVAQLLEQANLNPIGKTIKFISTETIENELHKNPMIKMAECFKSPSGTLKIKITQRRPKFRVVGFGSYYVDADRKTMPVSPNYAAYVPVVSGRITVSMARGRMFDFITFLEENPFWNAQIEQIHIRDDLKVELVPRVGDAIIVLGKLDNFESKLKKLNKLYTQGFNKIGWNKYKTIDLQYKDQVVCTKIGAQSTHKVTVEVEKKDSIIAHKL